MEEKVIEVAFDNVPLWVEAAAVWAVEKAPNVYVDVESSRYS